MDAWFPDQIEVRLSLSAPPCSGPRRACRSSQLLWERELGHCGRGVMCRAALTLFLPAAQTMKTVGNARARAIWEGNWPAGQQIPDDNSSRCPSAFAAPACAPRWIWGPLTSGGASQGRDGRLPCGQVPAQKVLQAGPAAGRDSGPGPAPVLPEGPSLPRCNLRDGQPCLTYLHVISLVPHTPGTARPLSAAQQRPRKPTAQRCLPPVLSRPHSPAQCCPFPRLSSPPMYCVHCLPSPLLLHLSPAPRAPLLLAELPSPTVAIRSSSGPPRLCSDIVRAGLQGKGLPGMKVVQTKAQQQSAAAEAAQRQKEAAKSRAAARAQARAARGGGTYVVSPPPSPGHSTHHHFIPWPAISGLFLIARDYSVDDTHEFRITHDSQ